MADAKNQEGKFEEQQQPAFPSNRKPDLMTLSNKKNIVHSSDNSEPNKKQKLETSSDHSHHYSSPSQGKKLDDEEEDDDDEEDYEEDEEDDDDDDDDDDAKDHTNGKTEIDRKGKGILVAEDKGKGKLFQQHEEEEEEDSDDSSGCESAEDEDDDSDLSDDPLTEVDFSNILPSRTRRRQRSIQPGLHISNKEVRDDDDDSHA